MIDQLSRNLNTRSAALLVTIDNRLHRILQGWLLVAGLLAAARIAVSSPPGGSPVFSTWASYTLLVVAPFASTMLALHWFRDGHRQPQPGIRLAQVGRWRTVTRHESEQHPLYGTTEIM